jgi:flagellar biosynthesis component FlhA
MPFSQEPLDANVINVITLDSDVERLLANSLVDIGLGPELRLEPSLQQRFLTQLEAALTWCWQEGYQKTALLCDGRLRRHVRRLIERKHPQTAVLSYAEIAPGFQIEVLRTLSFTDGENVGLF